MDPVNPPADDLALLSPLMTNHQIHLMANEVLDALADVARRDSGTVMAILTDALAQVLATAPPEQATDAEADIVQSLKLLLVAYRTKIHAAVAAGETPPVKES